MHAQIYDPVKWSFELKDLPSAEKEILMTATIENGWHLYDMNLPEGGPISTSISFKHVRGAELTGKPFASVPPVEVFDQTFNMQLRWYANTVTFIQKIKMTDHRKFGVSGEVEYMVCNNETCLPPTRVPFSFGRKDIKNIPEAGSDVAEPDDSL
ncbi:MAG: protein-disulfide reductase DsbD N-terminal domain-containing protein, partial [Tannerella sp.]|nr:protein-disulfide reductase DsbD N-terminal domain-containing protein [Tannerella sp.]